MNHSPTPPQSIGRIRRVSGFVLVGLGAAVWMRIGWLVAFYSLAFGFNEWARVAGLLWLGAVMALTGLWLAYRWGLAAWAAGVILVVPFVLAFLDEWLG